MTVDTTHRYSKALLIKSVYGLRVYEHHTKFSTLIVRGINVKTDEAEVVLDLTLNRLDFKSAIS